MRRKLTPPALVCQVGATTLRYHLRAIEDLHVWLKRQDDWVPLGAADESKAAADGTVEALGRASDNPSLLVALAGAWLVHRSSPAKRKRMGESSMWPRGRNGYSPILGVQSDLISKGDLWQS